ncbi:MAG: hypothetical protein R3B49_03270 [Phycisphaerales bacterium]
MSGTEALKYGSAPDRAEVGDVLRLVHVPQEPDLDGQSDGRNGSELRPAAHDERSSS